MIGQLTFDGSAWTCHPFQSDSCWHRAWDALKWMDMDVHRSFESFEFFRHRATVSQMETSIFSSICFTGSCVSLVGSHMGLCWRYCSQEKTACTSFGPVWKLRPPLCLDSWMRRGVSFIASYLYSWSNEGVKQKTGVCQTVPWILKLHTTLVGTCVVAVWGLCRCLILKFVAENFCGDVFFFIFLATLFGALCQDHVKNV